VVMAEKAKVTKKSAKAAVKTEKAENKSGAKFAVVEVAGTQLMVEPGGKYEINKLPGAKGDKVLLDKVLLVSDGKDAKVGAPYIDGAKVSAVIDSQKKDKKVRVFKYKSKSRYRRTYGHRAEITRLEIKDISA